MTATATENTFSGAGGIEIFWREWLPAGDPVAVVVISHGMSEHCGRYEHVASHLTGHGYAVYALDHRGHGRSGGTRCYIDRMDHAVADLDTLVMMARERHPEKEAILLGHSMGGAVSLAYTAQHQDHLDRLVLSAPSVSPETAPAPIRIVAKALSVVAPKLGIFDIDASLVSTDPEVVRDYEEDPLNFHGKGPARTVAEVLDVIVALPDQLPSLKLPLLVMHGGGDQIVPMSASEMVHDQAGSPSKQIEIFPGMYHEILNEPEQQKVLDQITAWLAEGS